MALILAVLLVFSSCSEPENEIPGSVKSIAVRVVDGTGARTITPDGAVDVTHYMITIHNDAENINQESGYLTKGSMFSVSNVPAGTWYATVDAYIMRGESDYLKVASAQSDAQEVTAGASATLTVNLDKDSLLTDVKSGDVTVTLTMPSALAADSTTFYYQYEITGLTNDSFTYSSSMTSGTVGADGTAEITISAETAGLVQGAYRLEITVQDSQTSPAITRKGVDVMRLLPGLAATGAIDLSTYEADQSFQLTITDKIGNKLTPSIQDGEETYTLDGQSGENTLKVKLVEPVGESETIDWYVDGTVDETVDETNASTGEYTLSFQPGNHNVTAIVRDTATAMAVGSISPFKVSLVNASIEAELFTFELNEDGKSYTVTGTVEGFVQPDSTRFEIPSTYKGLPVTRIAGDAFSDRTDITGTLVLPQSLIEIENGYISGGTDYGAFYGCTGLTGTLIIPDSVTSIGNYAFRNCSGFTGSLDIPDSVISIGKYAFFGCTGFNGTLTIGSKVETIGDSAFRNCSGFTGSLVIPNSVTSIGWDTFRNCSGFNDTLTIGSNVETIGSNAFEGCSNLTGELVIPDSMTSIGSSTFSGCKGFTGELKIPESVTSIGGDAFRNCSGFTGNLVIPNSVTSIGSDAFLNCSSFTGSLVIPNSVTSIGNRAFRGCSGFTGSLTIGSNVETIGSNAFEGCSSFTGDLVLPDSVTSIGSSAFEGCSGFNGSLVIPSSVTSIGEYAFQNCSGFTGNLVIPDSVTSIGKQAFMDCTGFNGTLTIGNSVTSIGWYAFDGCSGFNGELKIPDSVTSIGGYAFAHCSFESITVPWAEGSRPADWEGRWNTDYTGEIIYSE